MHAASPAQETSCARHIVSTLARRAFRRPVNNADMDMLMGFYQQGRKDGSFDAGVEMALRRILVEGGGHTISTFLTAGALDRMHVSPVMSRPETSTMPASIAVVVRAARGRQRWSLRWTARSEKTGIMNAQRSFRHGAGNAG